MKEFIMGELKNKFRPEFLNRLDEIIVFNQLNEENIKNIVDIMLSDTINRLKEKEIFLDYDKELNKFIADKNENLSFGARPIRRIITREIEDKLSDELMSAYEADYNEMKESFIYGQPLTFGELMERLKGFLLR